MNIPGKSLLSRIFRNCAEPKGALGRMMQRMMNHGHRPVYDWTFDHCPLADGMRALDIGCDGDAHDGQDEDGPHNGAALAERLGKM